MSSEQIPPQPADTDPDAAAEAGGAGGELDGGPFACDVCHTAAVDVLVTMLEDRSTIGYCMPCLAGSVLSIADQGGT